MREPLPPHDLRAEQAVLGCILVAGGFDNYALEDVAAYLTADQFYRDAHQTIFRTLLELNAEHTPPELLTLASRLEQRGELESVGGYAYLDQLANLDPNLNSFNINHYARAVVECATRRRFQQALQQLAALAYDTALTPDEGLAQARALLDGVQAAADAGSAGADGTLSLPELFALDLPEPRWVVPGVLPEGLTVLAGKPKSGKSWLALGIALAVAFGGMALGTTRVPQGGVLYLALEDTPRRLRSRVQQIVNGNQLASPLPAALRVQTQWPRLDAGGLAKLEQHLRRYPQTRLIIVDTLAKVRPKQAPNGNVYQEDYGALEGLKAIADQHGIAVVVIHHVRKLAAADPFDEISGSTGLTGAADASMVLRRERGGTAATLHVTGRDVDDQELGLIFDGSRGSWTLVGDAEEVRRTQRQQTVLDILKEADGPLSIAEVADMLRGRYDEAKNLLWYLERKGVIVKALRGRYELSKMPEDGYTAEECQQLNANRNVAEETAEPGAARADGRSGEAQPRESSAISTSSATSTFVPSRPDRPWTSHTIHPDREQIVAMLHAAGEPQLIPEVADYFGETVEWAKTKLWKLWKEGTIARTRRGMYAALGKVAAAEVVGPAEVVEEVERVSSNGHARPLLSQAPPGRTAVSAESPAAAGTDAGLPWEDELTAGDGDEEDEEGP